MMIDYIWSTLNAVLSIMIMLRVFYYKRSSQAEFNILAGWLARLLAFVCFFIAYRWWHGDYNGHADWADVIFKAIVAFALFRQKGNVAAMFKNWDSRYNCLETRYLLLRKRFKEKYYGGKTKMVKRS